MLQQLALRRMRTPDFHELRLRREIPLFVYGREKMNGPLNYILKDCPFYGLAHTVGDRYVLRADKTYTEAIAFQTDESHPSKGNIRGEVYGVDVRHIHYLDQEHRNTERFSRESKLVFVENEILRDTKIIREMSSIKAMMYLGITGYWKDMDLVPKTCFKFDYVEKLKGKSVYDHINYKTSILDTDDPTWNLRQDFNDVRVG